MRLLLLLLLLLLLIMMMRLLRRRRGEWLERVCLQRGCLEALLGRLGRAVRSYRCRSLYWRRPAVLGSNHRSSCLCR